MDATIVLQAAEQREIDIEKKLPSEHIKPIPSEQSDTESGSSSDPSWAPGFWVRFPWLGFGALLIVLTCSAGSIMTLLLSRGKSETRWVKHLAPNVILNVLNSVANIAFGIAIGNGIAIAWWRKTLKGATIQQLHRSWAFSTSVKEVALAGKYFNFIALAALTAKMTIIDGTLMQKAFSTYTATDNPINSTRVSGYANDTIPITGFTSGRSGETGLLSYAFSQELKIWAQSGGVYPNPFSGCDGLCFLQVPAAGFEIACEDPITEAVDFGNTTYFATLALSQGSASDTVADEDYSPTLFNVGFNAAYRSPGTGAEADGTDYSYITMDLAYSVAEDVASASSSSKCPGSLVTRHCKLRPAVVSYPVQIANYAQAHAHNGLSLGTLDKYPGGNNSDIYLKIGAYDAALKQQEGFKVLRYTDIHEDHLAAAFNTETRVGGLQKGFQMYLGGTASLTFGGTIGYQITQNGSAPNYLENQTPINSSQCGYQFTNPLAPSDDSDLPSVVSEINRIMFLNAMKQGGADPNGGDAAILEVTAAGDAGLTNYTAIEFRDTIHYATNIWYMIGATISTFICVLCVLPAYWGFWQLGRKVALSPFEIAAAFRSPMVNTGGDIDDILKETGHREVQYGHIVTGDAAGRLGVAEPEYVERAHPKIGSAKQDINEKLGGILKLTA